MHLRSFMFAVSACLILGGCSADTDANSSGDDMGVTDVTGQVLASEPETAEREPERVAQSESEPAPEPQPEDLFAIPDEITPDYLTRVLNELWRLSSETTLKARDELEAGELVTPELMSELRAIHEERALGFAASSLQNVVDESFKRAPEDYEQPRYDVEHILTASSDCIVLTGVFDIRGSARIDFEGDPLRRDSYVVLNRADEARDPAGFNTTPWVMALVSENPEPDPDFYKEFCP